MHNTILHHIISATPALPHKLQGLAVYFYGGAADVEELVADDDFLALDALDERHATGKGTVGDAHLVALSARTVDEGGVAGVYDAAEIVELGIGDDVGVFLPGIASILYTSGRKRMWLRCCTATLTKTKVERTTNSRMQRLPRLLTTTRLSVGTQASIGRPRSWKSCSMASMNFFS